MRLLRLEVSHCRGIASAEVDLEPGLNVLHGPNELGKSTLAEAVRAALLVQTSSSTAGTLRDWHADAAPEVTLVFEEQAERYWRVRKRFAVGGGSAYLDFSRDGESFTQDNKGREVEAALQAILRWGIEPPGGSRGPRGAPESLIATALLGTQTDATAILGGNLSKDRSTTGRDHLVEALQALAEDPRFKLVLNDVQEKVSEAFTETGRKRGGRASPWTQLKLEREQAEVRRRDIAERQREGEGARLAAADLRDGYELAREDAERLRNALAERRERERLEAELSDASAALAEVQAVVDRLAATESRRAECEQEARGLRAQQAEHEKQLGDLAPQVAAAQQVVADLESGAGEQGRRLREQELDNDLLRLRQEAVELERRIEALTDIVDLGEKVDDLRTELDEKRTLLAQGQAKTEEDEADLEDLELLRAVRRFKASLAAARQAQADRDEVLAQADRARDLQQQARALRTEIEAMAAPDDAAMARLRAAATELRIAQEKLAVGIAVDIALADWRTARVEVDGAAHDVQASDAATAFEARSELHVTIPEVAEIHVRGGGRDLLRDAEAAQKRWHEASESTFARTGCSSVEELEDLRQRADAKGREEAEIERQAAEATALASDIDATERRLLEAKALADEHTRQVEEFLQDDETLEDLLAEVSDAPAGNLDAQTEELAARIRERKELIDQMSIRIKADEREAELLAARLDELRRQVDEAAESAAWRSLLAAAERRRDEVASALEAAEKELDALRVETGQELQEARSKLAALQAAEHEARQALADTDARRQDAERTLAGLDGQLGPLRQQAAKLDPDAAKSAVESAQRAVDAMPPPVDDGYARIELDELARRAATAEQHAQSTKSELDKAEGALQLLGGQVLEEQASQATEALAALDDRQHELEVDYGAWQMLREVLKLAEAEDAVHLGRALVKPVSERIGELTAGRYGEVAIGPQLNPSGIELGGAERSFEALSVGTREQIALLIRLGIAEALGSFIVLDDQLTQTDRPRLAWMRDTLARAAKDIQIIVLTCHPDDYAGPGPSNMVDLTKCVHRGAPATRSESPMRPPERLRASEPLPMPTESASRAEAPQPRRRRRHRDNDGEAEAVDLTEALKDSLR